MGETVDRTAFDVWRGERTLTEVSKDLGLRLQWLSMWKLHKAEIHDRDLEKWEEITGISKDVLMAGRLESNTRFI
jgi:hypothetical protein